jgi:predicted Zn-dependent protease with MMP-like domain
MKLSRLTALASRVVAATQAGLPAPIRDLAGRVPVHFEAVPSEDITLEGFEPDILGLFSGAAQGDDPGADNIIPAQISLYLENIWDYAEGDPRVFQEEVRLTYLHELGHFLGWDEEDLTARGLD